MSSKFYGKPWSSMEINHGFPCLLNGIMENDFHGEKPWFPWKKNMVSMKKNHGFIINKLTLKDK